MTLTARSIRRAWRLRLTLFRQSHESRRSTLLPRITLAVAAASVFLSTAMSGSVAGAVRNGVAPARQLHLRMKTRDGKADRPIDAAVYRRIREQLAAFRCVSSGVQWRAGSIRTATSSVRGQIVAVEPEYFAAAGLRFDGGTFVPGAVVATKSAAARLLRGHAAVGATLHVDGEARVVSGMVDDPPDAGAMPQLFVALRKEDSVDSIDVVAPDAAVARTVAALLPGLVHGGGTGIDEALVVERPSARASADDQVRHSFRVAAIVVAAVTLAGGMAGFVASVLLLARERLREIALRRALGASRPRIIAELVAETILFALGSTILGVVIGIAAEIVIARLRHWPASLPASAAAADIAFCVACTLAAGAIPLARSAWLDPAAALRGEWLFRRSSPVVR